MPRNGTLVRITLAIAAVAVAAAVAAGAGSAAGKSGVTVQGAGSSLVAPAVAIWSTIWDGKTGNTVTYSSVGSGQGEAQISNKQVNFGASDAPLSSYPPGSCQGCVQIPWALSATVPVYNIPGVKNGKLHLSGAVLANIYLGKIKKWSAKPIKKLNPKLHLPNKTISVFYRQDGSGDTFVFTSYLSSVSSAWKRGPGAGTSVQWPVGSAEPKNAGVAQAVKSTSGAIGYVGAAYVANDHLTAAAMQNRSKAFVKVSVGSIATAAKLVKKVRPNNEISLVNPPKSKKYKKAWPLATFTYVFLHKKGDISASGTATTKAFIKWVVDHGSRSVADLMFAPLSPVVIHADVKTLSHVTFAG
jgi:phosphate transport system substrate-binding protein